MGVYLDIKAMFPASNPAFNVPRKRPAMAGVHHVSPDPATLQPKVRLFTDLLYPYSE